jgi:hypothetical protein
MADEQLEKNIGDLLESAQPVADLPPALRGRVMSALAQSRGGLRKRRWRLAPALAAAGVILFALGFVPFPASSAKGAVAKAIAAAENAVTVHFIEKSTDEKGNKYRSETWADDQGFYRRDDFDNGKLTWTIMYRGTTFLSFYAPKLDASESFNPNAVYRQEHNEIFPMLECWRRQPFFASLRNSSYYSDVKINEYKKRTLWGGLVIIADIKAVVYGKGVNGKPRVDQTQTYHLEIDPATDRIMKQDERWIAGKKDRRAETIYKWEVPIPDSVRKFTPPAGTKLTRGLWWQDKIDKVVAQGSSPNWEVTLHDVQIDNQGNILASLSMRHFVTDDNSNHGFRGFPEIIVADNVGNEYRNGNSGSVYAVSGQSYEILPITKATSKSAEIPATATFTFHLYQEGASKDQVVVFKDVPLPPRQPLTMKELLHKNDEVVQY